MALYPEFQTLSDISRYHGEHHGDLSALIFEDRESSYSELDQYASQVANGLTPLIDPGQRVAVLAKNNDHFFELLMAMGKCGGVLVGVNWRLAAAEIAYILKDSCTRVLFIEEEYFSLLQAIQGDLPELETVLTFGGELEGAQRYTAWRDSQATQEPELLVVGDDIAMQLYTSGTTGHPKGVQLSHRAMLSLREAEHRIGEWSQWDTTEIALVAMPLFHIGGTATGLISLYSGATAVIMSMVDPGEIIRLTRTHQVTRTFLVPAVIQMLLDHPDCDSGVFKSLKSLLYGASPIPAALLKRALEVMQCDFAQIYGMTETAGSMTVLEPSDHSDPFARKMSSCGKPYPSVEVAIVDPQGKRLPADEVGEIIIKSPSLMTGYWNNPDATEKTIKEGWLYSGDAGYLDDEGFLYIHDRMKDMIVSGGENIYPAEVESVLYAHADINDVAVIGVPDDKWGEAVKAVVVKTADSMLTAEQLILFARKSIAGYKLPKSVDFVSELPRNASGKLLKKDIRKPYWDGMTRRVN